MSAFSIAAATTEFIAAQHAKSDNRLSAAHCIRRKGALCPPGSTQGLHDRLMPSDPDIADGGGHQRAFGIAQDQVGAGLKPPSWPLLRGLRSRPSRAATGNHR